MKVIISGRYWSLMNDALDILLSGNYLMIPYFLNFRELEAYERVFICSSHPIYSEILFKLYLENPWIIGGTFGDKKTSCGSTMGIPSYDIEDAESLLCEKDAVIVFDIEDTKALQNISGAKLMNGGMWPAVLASPELAGFIWFVNHYQPEGCCLDVGANWGVNTGIIADKADEIYAFEPLQRFHNEGALYKFSSGNPNIHIIQSAVGDYTGEVQLRSFGGEGEEHYNSSIVANDQVLDGAVSSVLFGEYQTVPIVTIDDFCSANTVKPSFIKVDVEGAENKVIKGARKTIEKYKPILLLEMPGGCFHKGDGWDEEMAFLADIYDTISVPSIDRRNLADFHTAMPVSEFLDRYGYHPLNCGFIPKN